MAVGNWLETTNRVNAPPSIRDLRDTQPLEPAFAPLSARRLLVLTGIGMIPAGMIFGDIFAIFVLHQNASRVGAALSAAAQAALAGNASAVISSFKQVGGFLENRGTKVDTHVHLISFGYLALMLAIAQPWVALSENARRRLAWLFLFGGILLPVGVFLIHYVGLAYSPLQAIGWASIFADLGGLLVLLSTIGYLFGFIQHLRRADAGLKPAGNDLLNDRSIAGQSLLAGGLVLVLVGFAHGAWYAAADLYRHEAADYSILSRMSSAAGVQDSANVDQALNDYGTLQGEKAVNIAAHAHFIEFGTLAMILAFFQPYVGLRETWKRRWVWTLLLGSALLPVCVLLELRFGLLAGGLADFGGLLVIVALMAMWMGILRYTGSLDLAGEIGGAAKSETERAEDSNPGSAAARRILLFGGIALAALGMSYGLWYAVFAEHQALDRIGASLASSFSAAAQRNPALMESDLQHYREAKYVYDRQVDVHSHWMGLGLLLVVLAFGVHRANFSDGWKSLLAAVLLLGSGLFPLGVLLQTSNDGVIPRALAAAGSALVIGAMAVLALGIIRNRSHSASSRP